MRKSLLMAVVLPLLLFLSLDTIAQKPKYKVIIKSSKYEMGFEGKGYAHFGYLLDINDSTLVLGDLYDRGNYRKRATMDIKFINKIYVKRRGSFGRGFLVGFVPYLAWGIRSTGDPDYIVVGGFLLGIPFGVVLGIIANSGLLYTQKFKINKDYEYFLQIKPLLEKYKASTNGKAL